jgi:hypothetical protein
MVQGAGGPVPEIKGEHGGQQNQVQDDHECKVLFDQPHVEGISMELIVFVLHDLGLSIWIIP